jgi:enterochelin esterase-like enzyme
MNKTLNIKKIGILQFIFCLSLMCCCQKPTPQPNPTPFNRNIKDINIHSNILNQDLKYSVYLPDDYTTNTSQHYPVVYLLHGLGDNQNSWNDQWLHISTSINTMENEGRIPKMIYVMPYGFRSYYVNFYDASFNYMNFFVEEFVPYIDKIYRSYADAEHRAVVGYSMGGFGAMILPTKHPELFSVSIPLSMSFRTDEVYMTESASGWNDQWGRIFGGVGTTGEARLTDYYKKHCPYYIFTPNYDTKNVHYYYDCGDDEEQLEVANDRLHLQLRDNNIKHEYRVRDGAHTSEYWRHAMDEGAFEYIATLFSNNVWNDEPSVTVPQTYSAEKTIVNFGGVSTNVYKPQNFNNSLNYPLLLLFGDNINCKDENVMKILDEVQKNKPFILISINESQDINNVIASIKSQYPESKVSAIVYGNAGQNAYNLSISENNPFKNLFFIDANLGNDILETPNSNVLYYIAIADEGSNYKSANKLYEICHLLEKNNQYRVFNGKDSENSINFIIDKIKNDIKSKL